MTVVMSSKDFESSTPDEFINGSDLVGTYETCVMTCLSGDVGKMAAALSYSSLEA